VGVSQQTEDPIASSREISIEGQQLSYISNDVAPVVAKIVETAKLENFIVIKGYEIVGANKKRSQKKNRDVLMRKCLMLVPLTNLMV